VDTSSVGKSADYVTRKGVFCYLSHVAYLSRSARRPVRQQRQCLVKGGAGQLGGCGLEHTGDALKVAARAGWHLASALYRRIRRRAGKQCLCHRGTDANRAQQRPPVAAQRTRRRARALQRGKVALTQRARDRLLRKILGQVIENQCVCWLVEAALVCLAQMHKSIVAGSQPCGGSGTPAKAEPRRERHDAQLYSFMLRDYN